jgi:hypothetical protein
MAAGGDDFEGGVLVFGGENEGLKEKKVHGVVNCGQAASAGGSPARRRRRRPFPAMRAVEFAFRASRRRLAASARRQRAVFAPQVHARRERVEHLVALALPLGANLAVEHLVADVARREDRQAGEGGYFFGRAGHSHNRALDFGEQLVDAHRIDRDFVGWQSSKRTKSGRIGSPSFVACEPRISVDDTESASMIANLSIRPGMMPKSSRSGVQYDLRADPFGRLILAFSRVAADRAQRDDEFGVVFERARRFSSERICSRMSLMRLRALRAWRREAST